MNYYEHHLGDYARDTGHLSLVEDAVYTRMIRRYYLQEGPLPADVGQVARLVGARDPEALAAVEAVLAEFFTLAADGWHNKRCDEEVARYRDKTGKAKASAAARWSGHSPVMPSDSERNANAMRTHSEGNAHQTPDTRHQTPEDQKLSALRADVGGKRANPVPSAEIVSLYHEKLPMLPKVEKLTKARIGYIRQRWAEDLPTLEAWGNFFDDVSGSLFLTGRAPARDGKPPFRADLEWLTRPGNFAKIAEGKYHR